MPVYAYFDTKPYVLGTDKIDIRTKPEVKNIAHLYTKETLENEVILKDAIVIWKHKRNAIIKQSNEGRGLFLYGCAGELKVGMKYDLLVRAIKSYKGLQEATHVYILKSRGQGNICEY